MKPGSNEGQRRKPDQIPLLSVVRKAAESSGSVLVVNTARRMVRALRLGPANGSANAAYRTSLSLLATHFGWGDAAMPRHRMPHCSDHPAERSIYDEHGIVWCVVCYPPETHGAIYRPLDLDEPPDPFEDV